MFNLIGLINLKINYFQTSILIVLFFPTFQNGVKFYNNNYMIIYIIFF